MHHLQGLAGQEPKVCKITNGNWLASSPGSYPITFAVTAHTREAALAAFQRTLMIWERARLEADTDAAPVQRDWL